MTLPTDIDPTPQAWLIAVVANMQVQQDAKYHDALAIYMQASSDWVAANVINRSIGKPFSPLPTIPQHEVIYAKAGNMIGQYTEDVDPTIPIPQLPAATGVTPSVPLGSGAGANTDMQNQMLQTILDTVLDIQAKLAAKVSV